MKLKPFLNFFASLAICVLAAIAVTDVTQLTFAMALALVFAASVLFSLVPTEKNAAHVSLLKQIWISQIMEKFYAQANHLSRSVDMSEFVDFNTINLADAGIDPDVLVNNTTYPIDVMDRSDSLLQLPLNYYDTKNTVVRNAEQAQLSYNKLESVIRGHRKVLMQKCGADATYAYGPAGNTSLTPVLSTTGTSVGGFNNMQISDIATMQEVFDTLNVPEENRLLVLHPQHKQQIMSQDALLFKSFSDLKEGQLLRLFGFDIYWSNQTPLYDYSTGLKLAQGATSGTQSIASLFYSADEVMKADGDVDMFSRVDDPEARGTLVGFQKRFIGLPIRNKYIGAMFSYHA